MIVRVEIEGRITTWRNETSYQDVLNFLATPEGRSMGVDVTIRGNGNPWGKKKGKQE